MTLLIKQKMKVYHFLIAICLAQSSEDEGDCLLCQILNDNPLKLAPSQAQIDQLLLHHVLVKISQIEETQKQLVEKNAILDKISNLVQVVIKSTGKFEQLEQRVAELEQSVNNQVNRISDLGTVKIDLEQLKSVVHETNTTMLDIIGEKQIVLEKRVGKLDSFVGWEYAR